MADWHPILPSEHSNQIEWDLVSGYIRVWVNGRWVYSAERCRASVAEIRGYALIEETKEADLVRTNEEIGFII